MWLLVNYRWGSDPNVRKCIISVLTTSWIFIHADELAFGSCSKILEIQEKSCSPKITLAKKSPYKAVLNMRFVGPVMFLCPQSLEKNVLNIYN